MWAFLAQATLICLAAGPARATEDRISHVNVLLPWRKRSATPVTGDVAETRPSEEHTTQMLEAKPGCFRWESNSPEVAEVVPQFENDAERKAQCSSRALVRAVWQHRERAMSIVSAMKMDSAMQHVLGYELQCEVWVAPVARIQILTTVRTLSLGYSEKIEVQAFDDRDNVFTSLAGVHFDWRDVDFNVLRVIRLKSTNVMMTKAQEKVEAEGMLGDSVQIEGIKTGRGGLEVRPLDKWYEHLSAKVEINVTQPLKIQPRSAVYIAPASELQMELWTHSRNNNGLWRPEQIFMPTDGYKWEVGDAGNSDGEAIRVDKNQGVVVARHTGGPFSIMARDQEILDHFAFHKLTVSIPTSLTLAMARKDDQLSTAYLYSANGGTPSMPENEMHPWYLVLGREYAVVAVLRDEDRHRMYLTQNIEFDIQFGIEVEGADKEENENNAATIKAGSDDYTGRLTEVADVGASALERISADFLPTDLRLRPEWRNQRRWVKATAVGRTYVHAEMLPVTSTYFAGKEDPIVYEPPNGPLRASTLCIISHPVALVHPPDHSPILLPPDQSFRLHANGGTGDYVWTIADGDQLASILSSSRASSTTGSEAIPNAIASVHKRDGVITSNTELGETTILVKDGANGYNFAHAKVSVASVEGIHFINGPLEAEVLNSATVGSRSSSSSSNTINRDNGGGVKEGRSDYSDQDNDLYVRIGATDAGSNHFHACDSIFDSLTVDETLFDSTVFKIVAKFRGNFERKNSNDADLNDFTPYVPGSDRYLRSQACMTLQIRPLREGTTTLKISFGTGARRLTTSVEVTAFPPLQVLVPGVMKTTLVVDGDTGDVGEQKWGLMPTAVVSLGAIARIQLAGGPPPRGMKGMGRQTIDTVTMPRPDDVELEFLPLDATDEKELAHKRDQKEDAQKNAGAVSGDCKSSPTLDETGLLPGRRYALKCTALGEQNVTFTVTNFWRMLARPESMAHPQPMLRTVVVRFVCAEPIHTQLILQSGASIAETGCSIPEDADLDEDDDSTNERIANDLDSDPSYIIRTLAPVPVYLRVLDHSCRPFMNFSTILTSWAVTAGSSMSGFSGNISPVQFLHRECIRRIVNGKQASRKSFTDEYGEVDISVIRECLRDQHSAQNSGLPGPDGIYDTRTFSSARDLVELGEMSTMLERAFIFSAADEGTARIRVNASACAHTDGVGQIQNVYTSRGDTLGRGCPKAQLQRGASLQLVRNVRLTPKYSTIFRHPDNILRIFAVGGSGQFSFTSSVGSDFAIIGQNSSDRVEVSPGQTNGKAVVTVTDTGLTETMCATSEVFISEVARLEIWVMAYPVDSEDGAQEEPFSQDQLALMNVTFQNDQSMAFVRAYFDLKIQGGPGGSSQNVFRVTNESLASVGTHGMVVTGRGKKGILGDTVITVHAEGTSQRTQKSVVYARDAIPIRIALLTDISISAPSRKLLVGNMMKIQVRGKSFETPFTFGSSNITFEWRSENGDILAIQHHRRYLNSRSGQANDDDYYASFTDHDSSDFAVWISAKAAGESVVHVTVVSRPKGFPAQKFTRSIPFTVVAPLQLISPSSILLWPGATAIIRTNADVNEKLRYTQANSKWAHKSHPISTSTDNIDSSGQGDKKISSPTLVSFEGHGTIRAGSVLGRTTITIYNDADEQAVTVAVEIKDVAQMTLVGDTTMYVGEEKQLFLRLTDDLGRPFDLDGSALAVSTLFNNQSVFSITSSGSTGAISDSEHRQNHSFRVTANYEGESLVKFWRDGTSPTQISVDLATAQILAAMKSALVPKVYSKGTAEVFEAGTKIADYVKLHSISGNARAGTHTGTTFVNHRGLLASRARVLISRVEKMTLDSSESADQSSSQSRVVVPDQVFEFPISLYSSDGTEFVDVFGNASLRQNVQITCHIDEQAISNFMGLGGQALGRWGIVKAYSRYDSQSGQYFCAVNVSEHQEADWTSIQQEFPRVDALAISAKASDRQGTYTYSESFPNRIPYVPNMRPSAGEVSAFVDVYGKTEWHSGSIRASTSASENKPLVMAHEDVSAVLVEQEEQRGGWTRYRYLITPNLKAQKSSGTGAFEQRSNFAIAKYDAVLLMRVSSVSHQVKSQALTVVMLQTGHIKIARYLTMLQMVERAQERQGVAMKT
eukprot:g48.t1